MKKLSIKRVAISRALSRFLFLKRVSQVGIEWVVHQLYIYVNIILYLLLPKLGNKRLTELASFMVEHIYWAFIFIIVLEAFVALIRWIFIRD
jgi:hypothetical protein